jgi:hypothetical protein
VPLVDQSKVLPPLTQNIGVVPLPEDVDNHAPAPSILSTIGAAFGADNAVVGAFTFARGKLATPNEVEPGYNPWDDIKGTPYEEHWKSFASSNNHRFSNMLKA